MVSVGDSKPGVTSSIPSLGGHGRVLLSKEFRSLTLACLHRDHDYVSCSCDITELLFKMAFKQTTKTNEVGNWEFY